eukprot:g6443.t1
MAMEETDAAVAQLVVKSLDVAQQAPSLSGLTRLEGLPEVLLLGTAGMRNSPKTQITRDKSPAKWVVENMNNNPLQGLPEPLQLSFDNVGKGQKGGMKGPYDGPWQKTIMCKYFQASGSSTAVVSMQPRRRLEDELAGEGQQGKKQGRRKSRPPKVYETKAGVSGFEFPPEKKKPCIEASVLRINCAEEEPA